MLSAAALFSDLLLLLLACCYLRYPSRLFISRTLRPVSPDLQARTVVETVARMEQAMAHDSVRVGNCDAAAGFICSNLTQVVLIPYLS